MMIKIAKGLVAVFLATLTTGFSFAQNVDSNYPPEDVDSTLVLESPAEASRNDRYVVETRAANTEMPATAASTTATSTTSSATTSAAANTSNDTKVGDDYVHEQNVFGLWHGWCGACKQAGLYVGAEATFLGAFNEPGQSVILHDLLTDHTTQGFSDPGIGAGIRSWIGIQCGGWGIRFRHWAIGDNNVDSRPLVPLHGQPALQEIYDLNAYTADVELTQQFCFGCWNVYSSFGGRHAQLQRNATVIGYGTQGGVDLFGLAMGSNEIEGSGFTFSLGASKPICCTCVRAFWGYRGSLLWADSTASVLTQAHAAVKTDFGVATASSRDKASASKDHSETVYINELQIGLQWSRCLCCVPATLFLRTAVEYQMWHTGGVNAQSTSYAFLRGGDPAIGGRVRASAEAHDGDLDLLGYVLSLGLAY